MADECELSTVHTTEGVALQEDKECSETLEVCHVSNNWDPPSSLHEFSEGGWAGWATAFGAFLVQFCAFGYITSFGVYQDFYTQHYLTNETSSAISWIGSTTAFLLMTVSLVSGLLHDRGYFYHLIIAGSFLHSLSLFMLSMSKPNHYYQIFLSQGLGLGIASGLVYIPTMAVISHHFRRRRTLVMTFVATGSPLGAIIHPIMLNNLLNGPLGFANGVRVSAGLISLFLLTACLCMRTRLDPPATPVNYIAVARKCIYDVPFMLLIAGTFLLQTGFYYPLFFFQLDSIKHGISVKFSFYSLVILNGSNCLGRFTSGFIASFTGVLNLTIVASISCGVLILGMIGLNNLASVIVLGMLYGYLSGLNVAMAPPLVATLTPDLSELGARMGICLFAAGFGGLIGAPISGALLTSNYTWWIPGLFSGTVSLAAAMMFIIMRYMFLKRQRVPGTLQDAVLEYILRRLIATRMIKEQTMQLLSIGFRYARRGGNLKRFAGCGFFVPLIDGLFNLV
ncbi:major facilitator superfamily domain-containing protein [Suillus discolor]|uniref:Major facilitator superfamily domain-containing protein n=1 Tax=Suillus discolor TaxID=1912936 RepID=A0A9P7JZB2_9AGAM|nr:major facilitator superfamily domain-containing protein [Suillus discolor]KAG2118699.1 major facilitator superfamily domain-containing protein [Suillus discolor]